MTPSGTVTFLFTDLEGSTQLWERHPEAMKPALARHDALMRAAIERHAGYVFKTMGDAFCAAFASADAALTAAEAAQRALEAEAWPDTGPLRARMAVHTGEPQERDGDFFGPAVNRVARLLSAGHGGQVLLSQSTRDHLAQLDPDALRDLGERRLKDLVRPERVYQFIIAGLPSEFPPLKTLDARVHNLPVLRTALIGREREVAAARALLQQTRAGLVTLTGPGGTGKTRLSLQIAADAIDEFDDGVFFVPLAPISEPEFVLSTIATTLGVREAEGRPIAETLQQALRDRHVLLVLDNFEQIVTAAPQVAALLTACPRLQLLVTSRLALRVRGEHTVPVPPLGSDSALALFVQRAQEVKPEFALTEENAGAVSEICRRLDGLPLALELAAARVKLLPPPALLKRLDSSLKLLTGGARDLPERQQTLRAAIAWSYDLLTPVEQTLFARLAIFVGGCSLASAEAVGGIDLELEVLDGLSSLVDKNLMRQLETDAPGSDDEPRFVMLETIREFGREQLAARGETTTLAERQLAYFHQLAHDAAPHLRTRQQNEWLRVLDADHDNLRAALEFAASTPGHEITGLELAGALSYFWATHGHFTEGRRWLERLNARVPPEQSRADALIGLSLLDYFQADFVSMRTRAENALALARASGDRASESYALAVLGVPTPAQPLEATHECNRQALEIARELGNQWLTAFALNTTAIEIQMRSESSRALWAESSDLFRQVGDRYWGTYQLIGHGYAWQFDGDYEASEAPFAEALVNSCDLRNLRGIALALSGLAAVRARRGDYAGAGQLFGASEALRTAINSPIPPVYRAVYERNVSEAREAGGTTLSEAWQQGSQLSVDEVVKLARALQTHANLLQ